MLRIASLLIALLTLSACATLQGEDRAAGPQSIEAIQAARMAALLSETAAAHPDRIWAAQSELAALERVLLTEIAPEPALQTVAGSLAPAPDLAGSRSLLAGVHLASYREYANLQSGWLELQAAAPDLLGGLEPRVAEVDLEERGVFLRLKAGPLDSAEAATALCAQLETAGHYCAPSDFEGGPLQR